jgi:hypothetical protein
MPVISAATPIPTALSALFLRFSLSMSLTVEGDAQGFIGGETQFI